MREIDLARQQHLDRRARRLDVDPHFDARKLAAVAHQQRRQPVIAGVALGGDAQHAGVLLPHPADVLLGLRQPLEDVLRGHQQPLAGGREHEPLADAQEERGAQPRFDAAQLVAERGLRQVQPVAGAREAPHSATAATSCRWRTSRSIHMRLLHHHDDDKEFPSCSAGPLDASMVLALLLQVTLALPSSHPFSPLTLRTAVAEADVLWSRYGVAIDLAVPGVASGDNEILTVVVVETPQALAASRWRRPLGAIKFDPNGTPAPLITVFVATFCVSCRARGCSAPSSGNGRRTMREEIIGRALGRVLAHEIGHYVLRSPRHADAGLMKPVHVGDALVGHRRHGFALSKAEAARIAPWQSARARR